MTAASAEPPADAARTADPWTTAGRPFDELIAEAAEADVDGWDFSWLDGRATEQRPSWG